MLQAISANLGNWLYPAWAGLCFVLCVVSLAYWWQVSRDWWRLAFAAGYVFMLFGFGLASLFSGVKPLYGREVVLPYSRLSWLVALLVTGAATVGMMHTLWSETCRRHQETKDVAMRDSIARLHARLAASDGEVG